MSPRSLVVVFLALTCGGSAAVGINRVMEQRSSSSEVETVPIVVAAIDVNRAVTLNGNLIKTRDFPKSLLPPGVITNVDDALGRTTVGPLVENEPIFDAKLSPKGSGRGLPALVPEGMRAFTILTPSMASGVAGFVFPGDRVDVLLTMKGREGSATSTLLQNVEVLASDQQIDAPTDGRTSMDTFRSVTLLVTPVQAARLYEGQSNGQLCLALRNLKDQESPDVPRVTMAELEGYKAEEPKGIPLDEKLKGVLGAFGKLLSQWPAKVAESTSAPAPPPPPAPLQSQYLHVHHGIGAFERIPVGLPGDAGTASTPDVMRAGVTPIPGDIDSVPAADAALNRAVGAGSRTFGSPAGAGFQVPGGVNR